MKVCIRRGTQDIGGTCIEIESQGKRLVLDVGLPLDCQESAELLPRVKGFREQDGSLLAVVLSHSHLDHYGLARYLLPGTQMIMGAATEHILQAAALFTSFGITFENVRHLEADKPLVIGPFSITPYLNDHSAYDAYSLLITADGMRLFYSGDLRGHGRKAGVFERFLKHPPPDIDVLLMEGTTIGRSASDVSLEAEREVEQSFAEHFRSSRGMVLMWSSGQNIDRLVSAFKACRKSRRMLILDMYTAEMLRAIDNPKLPQAGWDGIKVFLPISQRRRIIRGQQFEIAERYRSHRIYPKQLAAEAHRSVMLFRPSMLQELEAAGCLQDARLIYSLWPGYLKRAEQQPFQERLDRLGIPLIQFHTSGHAPPEDLRRFAKAVNPKMLVPIHSRATDRFAEFFENVQMKKDNHWWEVANGC